MKEAAKKYWATVLVFVSIVGVCLLFCYRKQGLFIDEIYTYGLSNSYYAPYLTDIKDGSLIDKTVTRAEVEAYLCVGDEDAFRFDSVYHNLKEDELLQMDRPRHQCGSVPADLHCPLCAGRGTLRKHGCLLCRHRPVRHECAGALDGDDDPDVYAADSLYRPPRPHGGASSA